MRVGCNGIKVDLSNPLCPDFSFDEKEKERLNRPFRHTLVVKLMGRQPSYGFMMKKLKQIWERKGKIDIFDLENDFYLVNFQNHEDYMGALIGGPWVILDAYLSISRWKPEFNPRIEKIESIVAWVRLPELPAPLFDKKFILNLGNDVGKAIRLDIHTAHRSRGKFARMCVELDLTKSLIPAFSVEGQKYIIEYENLSMMCTKCGWYGHNKESSKDVGEEAIERVVSQGLERNGDVEGVEEGQREGEIKRERVLAVKKHEGGMNRMYVGQQNSGSCENVPVAAADTYNRKKVSIKGKENLHPGGNFEKADLGVIGTGVGEIDGTPIDMDGRNVEGAASKGFAAVLKDTRARYKVDVVAILEPRISGSQAAKTIKNWGFQFSVRVEAEGFAGGIWLLWNNAELCVEVLVKEDQFIHCRLNLEGKGMLFTTVYANPSEQRRQRLWGLLYSLVGDTTEPWILAGDFNEIKSPWSKKEGEGSARQDAGNLISGFRIVA
ncbi:hypothetical protein K1719_023501 [Acacia pycnantha]|nr:hypothetical protein K1719_023501 [Acacia pycnantha]